MHLPEEEVNEYGEGPEDQIIEPSDLRWDIWLDHGVNPTEVV
jgi:virulence-associated protein VagC